MDLISAWAGLVAAPVAAALLLLALYRQYRREVTEINRDIGWQTMWHERIWDNDHIE